MPSPQGGGIKLTDYPVGGDKRAVKPGRRSDYHPVGRVAVLPFQYPVQTRNRVKNYHLDNIPLIDSWGIDIFVIDNLTVVMTEDFIHGRFLLYRHDLQNRLAVVGHDQLLAALFDSAKNLQHAYFEIFFRDWAYSHGHNIMRRSRNVN